MNKLALTSVKRRSLVRCLGSLEGSQESREGRLGRGLAGARSVIDPKLHPSYGAGYSTSQSLASHMWQHHRNLRAAVDPHGTKLVSPHGRQAPQVKPQGRQ